LPQGIEGERGADAGARGISRKLKGGYRAGKRWVLRGRRGTSLFTNVGARSGAKGAIRVGGSYLSGSGPGEGEVHWGGERRKAQRSSTNRKQELEDAGSGGQNDRTTSNPLRGKRDRSKR